jgi:predicted  nucleic acid-binding Zn-ribbon protein
MTPELTAIISTATTAIGYFLARGKNKAEVAKVHAEAEGIELKNVERAIEIWRTLAKDLHREVAELKTEIIFLRKENEELKKELIKLEKAIQKI